MSTTFNFDLASPWVTADVRRMHAETTRFMEDMEAASFSASSSRGRWLTLCGRSGCGKTHLAKASVSHAKAERGARFAQCWNWGRAMNLMLEGNWELMAQLCRLPLLAIDDIGAEFAGKIHTPKLYELLEARLGKWTIITSNLSIAEISERLDARIASRLFRHRSTVVQAKSAKDYCLEQTRLTSHQHQ